MTGIDPAPQSDPNRAPRLLTISEAAAATGFSRKAIARRVERGTLRAIKDDQGRRVVPRGELERTGMLGDDGAPGSPGGELVVWRNLYERERQERQEVNARVSELERELVAIANAGPIRAFRIRRQLRAKWLTTAKPVAGSNPVSPTA